MRITDCHTKQLSWGQCNTTHASKVLLPDCRWGHKVARNTTIVQVIMSNCTCLSNINQMLVVEVTVPEAMMCIMVVVAVAMVPTSCEHASVTEDLVA